MPTQEQIQKAVEQMIVIREKFLNDAKVAGFTDAQAWFMWQHLQLLRPESA